MRFVPEFISKRFGSHETKVSTPGATPENNVKLDTERMASMQASKDALVASAPPESSIISKPDLDKVTGFRQSSPNAQTNEELAAQVLKDAAAAAPTAETPQQPAATSTPLDKAA